MNQINSSIHLQLSEWLASGEESDVTLVVGEENPAVIQVHSFVLKLRSPVFKVMLSENWKSGNKILLAHDDPKVFRTFLQAVYGGNLPKRAQDALPLLSLAGKYVVEDLKDAVESSLMKNLTLDDIVQVFNASILHGSQTFHHHVYNTILINYEQISKTEHFYDIDRESLIQIISDDNLKVVKESSVYLSVIRWIRHQLNENDEECTGGNLNPEMELVNRLIPHIRFPLLEMQFLCTVVKVDNVLTAEELLKIISHACLGDSLAGQEELRFKVNPRKKNPIFPAVPVLRPESDEENLLPDIYISRIIQCRRMRHLPALTKISRGSDRV